MSTAEKAILETALIITAVARGADTPEWIAAATGLGVSEVRRRLRVNGPAQCRPEFTFFAHTGGRWGLTHQGLERLRAAGE